jgi:lipoprotein-anchoring transpeptidase ErfK/SrfK
MGAAALVLAGGKYAIHGTNRPSSIGTFASHGCFRMHNRDVLDLFGRVSVGTPVTVIP